MFFFFLVADLDTLKIWRYNDPNMGPRQLPEFQDYKKNKSLLGEGSLVVDVEKKTISLKQTNGGEDIPVGRYFVYIVE